MEQARQFFHQKTNEAQHAHQAMKEAEDYAIKLSRQAQLQTQKASDFALEVAKMTSVAEAQQPATMQTGYASAPAADFSDQMSKASDISYGNSRTSTMGYGGFPGTHSQFGDDASGLMGGSTGHGEGVNRGYASSVGLTDNSAYGGSTGHGSISGVGSTTHAPVGSVSHLQMGYVSDAASHSVASELLYQPAETPNSVTGGMSITGSVNQPGSVSNIQGGYTSDAASRSVASEMVYSSVDNTSTIGTATHPNVSANQPLGGYTSDAASRSVASDKVYPQPKDNIEGGSSVIHSAIENISAASIGTEEKNNYNKETQSINALQQETPVLANTQDYSYAAAVKQDINTIPSVEKGSSNEFGAFMAAGTNQSSDFDGIPSPEKQMDQLDSQSSESFDFTILKNDGEVMEPVVAESNKAPEIIPVIDVQPITMKKVEDNQTQKETDAATMVEESEDNLIPSPTNDSYTKDNCIANATPLMDNLKKVTSSETNDLVTVNLSPEEENTEVSNINTQSVDSGLIPSPEKDFSGVGQSMMAGKNESSDNISAMNLGQMSQSLDNEIPTVDTPVVMTQSIDNKSDINSINMGIMSQNQNMETGMNMGIMSHSTDGGMNMGIMSPSMDGGGIPTPTASKDEYEQAFW
jgi:hypothetical protein